MPDPIRLRALRRGEQVELRVLVTHVNESGLRRDEAGRLIPAWHLVELAVEWNGRMVLRTESAGGLSKDPVLRLMLTGPQAGDRIAVAWTDSRGERRRDETTVT